MIVQQFRPPRTPRGIHLFMSSFQLSSLTPVYICLRFAYPIWPPGTAHATVAICWVPPICIQSQQSYGCCIYCPTCGLAIVIMRQRQQNAEVETLSAWFGRSKKASVLSDNVLLYAVIDYRYHSDQPIGRNNELIIQRLRGRKTTLTQSLDNTGMRACCRLAALKAALQRRNTWTRHCRPANRPFSRFLTLRCEQIEEDRKERERERERERAVDVQRQLVLGGLN
jgi:hypothetical protein